MSGSDERDRPEVGLEDVLITEELQRRPSRPPDAAAENRALAVLAETLALDPPAALERIADSALELCRADSVGISILEPGADPRTFRWHAVAGRLRAHVGRSIPREASPSGIAVDRNAVLLVARPQRHFAHWIGLEPPISEALLVPFHSSGRPAGTVWAMVHDPDRQFEAEDARLLTSLSRFAAAAYRMIRTFDPAQAVRAELERRVAERTRELAEASLSLRESEAKFRGLVDLVPELLWQSDPAGRVGWLNRRWQEYTGQTPDQGFGSGWIDAIHPDDRQRLLTEYQHALETGERLRVDLRIRRAADGSYRWFSVQILAVRDDAERITTWFGSATDVHEQRTAMEALRESEERLRLIIECATDYAIFTLDGDRRVTSWNPGAEVIFGFTEEEMIGRSGDIIFTPEDRMSGAPEAEARTALREGRAADERWHLRKDGSRFYASGVLTSLRNGTFRGYAKVARDLTDRKRAEDDLREARVKLEARVAERTAELTRANDARIELLRRLVTIQEDERRRVSRELHDGLGQELTALILALKGLEPDLPERSPARDRLREVEAIVGGIGREVHDLAVELRPTALDDIGLVPALATYVAHWSERAGVAADFQSPGLGIERLPPEVETTVYRVVQEALNNVAKHAGARRVSVIVERRRDEVTALVEDDGQGFDLEQVRSRPDRRRLGLIGMRERLALVGGTLLVESGEGEWTTLRARIPLAQPPEEPHHGG